MAAIKIPTLIFIAFSLLFTACIKDSDDGQDPEVVLYQFAELADTLFFVAGEVNSFQIQITDESAIDSYKSYITFDQDTSSYVCQVTSDWVFIEINDGQPEVGVFEVQVQIPDSVKGFYNLLVEAYDEFGNLESVSSEVIITNSNVTNIIQLSMDSIVSSCSFFSDSLSMPELSIEAETNVLFSQANFYSKDSTSIELLSSNTVSSTDYLNNNFQIYSEIPETSEDTILLELKTTDNISMWNQFVLENQ